MITKTDLQNTLSTYNAVVDNELSRLDDRVTTLEKFHIFKYGVRIDQSNSDPDAAVTYLYDAVGKTPAGLDNNNVFDYGDWQDFVYDICKPVMLNLDGTVKYELDRDDQTKKADGTASEISDSTQTANAMVQFKKRYVSVTEPETDIIDIVFSNQKIDDTYHALGFEDGTSGDVVEKDYFYHSMFSASEPTTGEFRSLNLSYSTNSSRSAVEQRALIKSIGNNWDFISFAQNHFLLYLHYLISKSLNIKMHFGSAIMWNNRPTSPLHCAQGGFVGNKTTAGVPKSFWIEGLLGGVNSSWVVGAQADHIAHKFYIKDFPPYTLVLERNQLDPNEEITIACPVHSSAVFIKKMQVLNNRYLFEKTTGGSSTTYWTAPSHNDNSSANGVAGFFPIGEIYSNGYPPAIYDYNNGNNTGHSTWEPRMVYL